MRTFDFSFNLNETYTFWSGLIGGAFLMLSYFGTDQSQVQRYLTAKSVPEARTSLLMSAYWKIPLQALILIVGVLVFVFYLFRPGPLLYNPAQEAAVRAARPRRIRVARTALRDLARRERRRGPEIAADVPGAVEKFRELQSRTSSVRTEAPGPRGHGHRRSVPRRQLHHPAVRAARAATGARRTLHRAV
jgi:hypothetical protein